jgi:hypothetical protein
MDLRYRSKSVAADCPHGYYASSIEAQPKRVRLIIQAHVFLVVAFNTCAYALKISDTPFIVQCRQHCTQICRSALTAISNATCDQSESHRNDIVIV